jgi:glycerophosphoryl diester phosphodiesterase
MMHDLWAGSSNLKPLVIAHRGGAALAEENTVSALHAAVAAGADAIETDVRITQDGFLVCVHDADLQRLCSDPRQISDLDLATLRSLLPTVMTLQDALAASAPLGVLLDIKLSDEQYLSKIIGEIGLAGAASRAILGLRSLALIAAARAITANIAILAFLEDPECATTARVAGADWFRLWQGAATTERVAAVRNAGMRLAVMVGQPRSIPLPEYPQFPVGLADHEGLERVSTVAPDAVLLDDPRLVKERAIL